MPIMNALNVHCTEETGVSKACAVAGTPGRLMSEANSPPAFSEHSTASSSAYGALAGVVCMVSPVLYFRMPTVPGERRVARGMQRECRAWGGGGARPGRV